MTQPSVLSVTGVMVVFLLNSGYSLKVVTVAEAISTLFEFSSTFVTPFAIARLAAHVPPRIDIEMFQEAGEQEDDAGLSPTKGSAEPIKVAITKVGFWGILSMLVALVSSYLI
jgi:iron-regulated transporter 1